MPLDVAAESALVLVAALVFNLFLRRYTANLRHLVWTCAFAVCLFLSLFRLLAPPHIVRVSEPVDDQFISTPGIAAGSVSSNVPRNVPVRPPTPGVEARTAQRPNFLPELAEVWTTGTCLVLLVWVLGRFRALEILSNARDGTDLVCRPPSSGLGIRSVRIRISTGPAPYSAVTWGVIRPVILLPRSCSDWSERQLRSAIDHELAHIRRLDDLSQTLAWMVAAMNWFNPVVWIAVLAHRLQAELAADEIVAANRTHPADYADDLLGIASMTNMKKWPAAAGVGMLESRNLERRIKAIVRPGRTGSVNFIWLAGLALSAVATVAALASPQVQVATGTVASATDKGAPKVPQLDAFGHLSQSDLKLGHTLAVDHPTSTLYFFGDFECPACRAVGTEVLHTVRAAKTVQMTFFDFPLPSHPHARLAAQAMDAAGIQGADWRAFETLLSMKISEPAVRGLAQTLHLNEHRFSSDLDSRAVRERVQKSFDLARKLGLTYIPALIYVDEKGAVREIKGDGRGPAGRLKELKSVLPHP
jgi:beta-lactamase regulating signal transducer with metallopeptidase domain